MWMSDSGSADCVNGNYYQSVDVYYADLLRTNAVFCL